MCIILPYLRRNSGNLLLWVIFSVPSRGLMTPGISSPKDKWSIRWEKLYAVMQKREEAQVQSRPRGITVQARSETGRKNNLHLKACT